MDWGDEHDHDDAGDTRGVSPQVGLILLFGMVAIGALLVVVTGIGLLDSFDSESEAEVARSAIGVTDQGISTTISTGEMQSIPWNDASYRDDGEVYIAWYNSSDEDPDVDTYEDTSVLIDSLGAIEYTLDDRTIAYQGGGRWESRDGETRVLSAPRISYDGENLLLRLVAVQEEDVQNEEATVRLNQSNEISAQIEDARANATNRGYDDIALIIESEYHDGWEHHFESALDHENVTINAGEQNPLFDGLGLGGDKTIQVTITDAMDIDPAMFWVKEDRGLLGGDEHARNNRFVYDSGKRLAFEATFENTGDAEQTQDVGVNITGSKLDDEIVANTSLTISGGESETVSSRTGKDSLSVPHGQYHTELEFGETYEYKLWTDDDDTHSGGEFYYAKQEDPYLEIANPTIDGVDASNFADPHEAMEENVTVEVDVHNVGATDVADDPDFDGELELSLDVPEHEEDWYEPMVTTVDRDFGENTTATWELNRSLLLEAEHEFTVTALESGDAATGAFVVEQGVDVEETELYLNPDTEVSVSFIGSELSSHGGGSNRWLPTFVNIFTQSVDENDDPIGEPYRHDQDDGVYWADSNINQHEDRLDILEYNFTTDERVSLMLQATSYSDCYEVVDRNGGRYRHGPEPIEDQWEYRGEEGGYNIYDCPTGNEQDKLVDLTAETDTEESNVRVLDQYQNTMPELEPGIDVQMRADELLDREGVEVPVVENRDPDVFDGEGYNLQLKENEFVFLFEITHHPEQHNYGPSLSWWTNWTNQRYWEEAFNRQGGDPNFNDVIAHVEINSAESPEDTELDGIFLDGDSKSVTVGTGDSSLNENRSRWDTDVDVGTDEIIIG